VQTRAGAVEGQSPEGHVDTAPATRADLLLLDEPTVAIWGSRFVVRGGGERVVCSQIATARSEELAGRVGTMLDLPVGRARWLATRLRLFARRDLVVGD
jgi:hypothetical protein